MFMDEYKRMVDENEPSSKRFVLDIDELLQSGIIVPGQTKTGRLCWNNSLGELRFSLGYQSDMTSEGEEWLKLHIFLFDGPTSALLRFDQVIPLSKTACGDVVSYWFVDTDGHYSRVLYFTAFASAFSPLAKALSCQA